MYLNKNKNVFFCVRLSFVYSFNSTASFACINGVVAAFVSQSCFFCIFITKLRSLIEIQIPMDRQASEYQFQNIGRSITLDVSILLCCTHTNIHSVSHTYVHSHRAERFSSKSQMPASIVNLTSASYWNCSKTQQWCHVMVFFLLDSPTVLSRILCLLLMICVCALVIIIPLHS